MRFGCVRDDAAPTRLRLSRGRDHVWVYGPEGETAGGEDLEQEAAYEKKLGAASQADVTLEMSRSAGSPRLALEIIEAVASRWKLVVDNNHEQLFTIEELHLRLGSSSIFWDWDWDWD